GKPVSRDASAQFQAGYVRAIQKQLIHVATDDYDTDPTRKSLLESVTHEPLERAAGRRVKRAPEHQEQVAFGGRPPTPRRARAEVVAHHSTWHVRVEVAR